MSVREQRLALAVGALVVLMGGYWLVQGVRGSVHRLDTEIDRLQDDVVNFHHQIARKQSVEAHYAEVSAQHSSAWTEPEIQERLRQEIYRLAKKSPPPLNEEGVPATTLSEEGNLVEIPGLGQGTLSEGEENYRQYSINFRVPPVELPALVAFLERLQGSPQSLRIDGLELVRPPDSTKVSATIDLTRIIVAGAAGADSEGAGLQVAEGTPLELRPDEWKCVGGEIVLTSEHATTGQDALKVTAQAEKALVYLPRGLPAGATYDLSIDLSATGQARMDIDTEAGGETFSGGDALRGDGKPYRYSVRFTVPGEAGEQTQLRLPVISLEGAGQSVYIDNWILTKSVS
ncbi:MAG: hypothetical protein HYZ00_02070 [Candidatus Hydrogenedentes bacterium]|nr:hypothetical protein [Candidatus Hydrogenedentota bacterium]